MVEVDRAQELAQRVRQLLDCGPVQLVGDPARQIERVALACGAAGEYLKDAVRLHADVFLTGEMRFHDYLSARARGLLGDEADNDADMVEIEAAVA